MSNWLQCNQVNILTAHASDQIKMLQASVLPKLFFPILETESEVEGKGKMAHFHDYTKVRPFSFWRREEVDRHMKTFL